MRTVLASVATICGLVLVAALVATADDKKETPKGGKALPSGWSKLGLSDEQKDKIYSIQGEYKSQIEALEKQVKELRHKEKLAMDEVLTDAQKARLKEILLDKAGLGDKNDKPSEKPIKP
jgi:TolA-binding protein